MTLRASVVIPTRNRRDLLARTLSSLESQSVPCQEFEVVVAMDGCDDGTAELVSAWPGQLNLRCVELPGAGAAEARNRAAEQAAAPIIVFLDDDQEAAVDLLEHHLELQERQGPLLVQGFYPLAPDHLKGGASRLYDRVYRRAMSAVATSPERPFTIWGGNFSIPRDHWRRLGGFDSRTFAGYGCEDADFGIRAERSGLRLVYEPRAVSFHLHRAGYASFCRQAVEEGGAAVELSRKHSLPLLPADGKRRLTDVLASGWRRAPLLMTVAMRAGVVSLWAADRVPSARLQVLAARVLRKLCLAKGVVAAEGRSSRAAERTPAAARPAPGR